MGILSFAKQIKVRAVSPGWKLFIFKEADILSQGNKCRKPVFYGHIDGQKIVEEKRDFLLYIFCR